MSRQVHGCKCKFNQLDEDISDTTYLGHPHCRYLSYPAGHVAYGQLVTVLDNRCLDGNEPFFFSVHG